MHAALLHNGGRGVGHAGALTLGEPHAGCPRWRQHRSKGSGRGVRCTHWRAGTQGSDWRAVLPAPQRRTGLVHRAHQHHRALYGVTAVGEQEVRPGAVSHSQVGQRDEGGAGKRWTHKVAEVDAVLREEGRGGGKDRHKQRQRGGEG